MTDFDPFPTTRVHETPGEVSQRLSELGLSLPVLFDAIHQGEFVRRSSSPLDPPAAPGFGAWARTVRALREALLPLGWEPRDNGISTVVNPTNLVAISVATGDEHTGNTDGRSPQTKYPRGSATAAAVNQNVQGILFGFVPDEVPAPTTWILLVRSSADGLIAELSFPHTMSAGGRVSEWSERIVLGRIDPDGTGDRLPLPDDADSEPIDVPLTRRTA